MQLQCRNRLLVLCADLTWILLGSRIWMTAGETATESSEADSNSTAVTKDWKGPGPKFPRTRQFSITCCRGGQPEPDPSIEPHLIDWTVKDIGYLSYDVTCKRFNGQMTLPSDVSAEVDKNFEIRCNCSEPDLDRNCRSLPPCLNSGYRSFSINLRCVCPPKWFGEVCENFCYNGNLVKGDKSVDECVCDPNFFGDNCDQIACLNQGVPSSTSRVCQCQFGYHGRFCEFYANHTESIFAQERHSGFFARDISATAVSLFLIISLCVAVYIVVKRRTNRIQDQLRQLQTAFVVSSSSVPTGSGMDSAAQDPPRIADIYLYGRRPPAYGESSVPLYENVHQQGYPGHSGSHVVAHAGYRSTEPINNSVDPICMSIDDLPPPPTYDEILKEDQARHGGGNGPVTVRVVGGSDCNNESANTVPPSRIQDS